ncbi:MAG: nucleotide-binding protein [Nitrososphaeria archaeon]
MKKEINEQKPDRLIVGKEEAKAKLQIQIEEGEAIAVLSVKTDAEVKQAQDKLDLWYDFTKEVLLRTFSTNKMADEFQRAVRSYAFDPLDNFRNEIDKRLNMLKSIMKRVDLYDDIVIPGTIAAPKTANRSINTKKVFVIHGRNKALLDSMTDFLRAIGLEPIEWNQAISLTNKPTPMIQDIVSTAFREAQAIVVLFSGDDIAKLRDEFVQNNDEQHEKEYTPQPRPNVLFEAGMAMTGNQDRTILVQVGKIRPFSDISGLHITNLDNSPQKRQELATKLKNAGCDIADISANQRWMNTGNFVGLTDSDHTNINKPIASVTDFRQKERKESSIDEKFIKLERLMPDLLTEMRQDLIEYPLIRELVILKKTWTYNPGGNRLIYYYEDHPDLDNKLQILQNYGLIQNISLSDPIRYRILEELIDYLLRE